MKSLNYKKFLYTFQIILSFISLSLFITNAIHNNVVNILKYYIATFIYAMPIIIAILCLIFFNKRNPRKKIQLSILSFYPLIPMSIFLYDDFELSSMLFNDNHIVLSYMLIFSLLFLIGIVIKSMFNISKNGYIITCSIIAGYLILNTIMAKVSFLDELILYYISYLCLLVTLMIYSIDLNDNNKYQVGFNLKFINNAELKDKISFDQIIDNILECYSSNSEKYSEAKKAYDYYYAIKNNNVVFLKHNINSREKASSIFKLWLKCESQFSYDATETLFFNLCKIMTNENMTDKDFEHNLKLFYRCVQNETNSYGIIDIDLNGDETMSALSNSYEGHFSFDNIEFASIESFLQGLKYKNQNKQAKIFKSTNKKISKFSKLNNLWKITGNLYFKGKKINRHGFEYYNLIMSAFNCKYNQCKEFRQSLFDTNLKTLHCSNHKTNEIETLLTQEEYIDILNYFRIKEFNKHYLYQTK